MSRTDVHIPFWVKARSRAWREFFYEVHDHSTGPCDITDFFNVTQAGRWHRTRCFMQYTTSIGDISCGCKLCTGQRDRKRARRRERAELRVQLRNVLKTDRGDIDTVDVPPPGPVRG